MQRFYTHVSQNNNHILLDGKHAKTPHNNHLIAPNQHLADIIVDEWQKQTETINLFAMRYTKLLNRTIDYTIPNPKNTIDTIIRWARADLICHPVQEPPALMKIQTKLWQKPRKNARTILNADFPTTTDIIAQPLPETTKRALLDYLNKQNPYILSAAENCAVLTASVILTLNLIENKMPPSQIWKAACVEQDWQMKKWGVIEEAQKTRAQAEHDFYVTADFIKKIKKT